jgi:hypothetical protein
MSRTIQDHDFLVWEVYTSGGRHGFSENAHIAFHCLTDRSLRPRLYVHRGDNAAAERTVATATPAELLALLHKAQEVP